MRAFVGVTDREWFEFLRVRPHLDEVNFWQPHGGRRFRALEPGEPFLFKLHAPANAVVGGGTFLWADSFPAWLAWEAFEEKNGAASFEEMRRRIERYRREPISASGVEEVGCILLSEPFFLAEPLWIPQPRDWSPNIVQGKTYDGSTPEGSALIAAGARAATDDGPELAGQVEPHLSLGVEGPVFGEPGY